MQRSFLFILFIFFQVVLSAQEGAIDVLHYKFEVELSDETDEIKGKATIRFNALQAADKVFFDFKHINARQKGMILVAAYEGGNKLKAYHPGDSLRIDLDRPMVVGERKEIVIEYVGIPADGLIISKNKYGQRTFFSDNWPNRAHNWLPCVDHPGDKASVEFLVTAPARYQVISNGVRIEETNISASKKLSHWKEDVPLPTKIMVIGAAEFAVNLAGTVRDSIPVYSWVYPAEREEGFYDYAIAPDILNWFIERIGPYPYKKLANVQSKTIFGGMENASAIFYSENSVDGKRSNEPTIAHEIAHQWFGNMATEKSFAHLWLSEGFATYMTILYMEAKYGSDTLLHMLKEDRQQVIAFAKKSGKAVVDPETTDYMSLLNANSYQKGGWVLHMLRRSLGDSVFWKGIRQYYKEYAGWNAGTDDFRRVMEKVSGKNLEKFFRQWLYTHGQPDLDIQWSYIESSKKVKLSITQKQNHVFEFPLDFKMVIGPDKYLYHSVKVSEKAETIEFYLDTKPGQIILDPDVSLLFEGKSRKN
jgi:aminopeptidase N